MKHALIKDIANILSPEYVQMLPKAFEAAKKIYGTIDFDGLDHSPDHIRELIPNLKWEETGDRNIESKTEFGTYEVYEEGDNWFWSHRFGTLHDEERSGCDNKDHGMRLSNAH